MSSEINITKGSETSKDPAPPIKAKKKHIKYKIIHGTFKKTKTLAPQNRLVKRIDDNNQKEIKVTEQQFSNRPSKEEWSIFSKNFMNTPKAEEKLTYSLSNVSKDLNNEERLTNKISRSVFNLIQSDEDKILKLEKEISGLKETNQNILNLIMEKEKENRNLINTIDQYKSESIENLSNYLNYIEELGKKFKFSNDDEDINLNITDDINETNEIKIELSKNRQLKKILEKKK